MSGSFDFATGAIVRVGVAALVSALAIVAGLWLAQSSSAVPTGEPALTTETPADSMIFQDVTCEGSVNEVDQSQPEPEPVPAGITGPTGDTGATGPTEEEEEEPPYIVENYFEYSFTCDKDVWAYSIVTNRDVATFDSETLGFTPPTEESPKGDPAPGEDFFCIGSIPSFGPACYGAVRGTPARQTKVSAGNTGRGNLVLDFPICEAYDQPQFWVVVMTELGSYNDTVNPVRVTGPWVVTSEPIPLDTSAVDCNEPLLLKSAINRQGNLYERALKACSTVAKVDSKKAKSRARAKCTRATKTARRFSA